MPKHPSYVRVIAAAFLLAGLGFAPACGSSDEDDDGGSSSGSGGSGGSTSAQAIECGGETCQPLVIPIAGAPPVIPCCAEGDVCGLDSSYLAAFGPTFDVACQPRDQPGVLDDSCPASEEQSIPDAGLSISFPGCCRSNGVCGYMLDSLFNTIEIGLGCVDSEPFLGGEAPQPCGSGGAPGAAGAGGSG